MKVKEVIEKIKKISAIETFMSETIWVKRDEVLDIIKRLDEPEKPIVPRFIADWYEENKDHLEWNLYNFCVNYYERELPDDLHEWFNDFKNKPIQTIVKMKLCGYEVENEKLYTVEIPNPNASGYGKTYLAKNKNNKVELFNWGCYTSIEFADNWKQEENAQLTESEIKKDHAWAWQFAKEVEE